jgi:predicted dehydrogenase
MPRALTAAVFGVGHLGRHHARILAGMEGVALRAVVDPDAERGRAAAERHGCAWHASAADLAELPDLAVVATPTVLHVEVAGALLRAGVHCLVEKPLAADPDGCRALIEAARDGGAVLTVGHVERFNPAVRRALALGIVPRFIEAHRLAPYPFRATDVGVVLDLMIHDLDLALAWTGSTITSVDAVGGATLSPTEDIASVRLRFANGAAANLTASRLSLKPMRRFRVFGPDCYVSVDSRDRYALLVRKAPGFSAAAVAAAAQAGDPQAAFRALLHVEELTVQEDEPLRAELADFVAAVRDGRAPTVGGEDGLRAVTAAHEVLAALARDPSWRAP